MAGEERRVPRRQRPREIARDEGVHGRAAEAGGQRGVGDLMHRGQREPGKPTGRRPPARDRLDEPDPLEDVQVAQSRSSSITRRRYRPSGQPRRADLRLGGRYATLAGAAEPPEELERRDGLVLEVAEELRPGSARRRTAVPSRASAGPVVASWAARRILDPQQRLARPALMPDPERPRRRASSLLRDHRRPVRDQGSWDVRRTRLPRRRPRLAAPPRRRRERSGRSAAGRRGAGCARRTTA